MNMQTSSLSEQIPDELNKGDMKKIMYSHKSKQGSFGECMITNGG